MSDNKYTFLLPAYKSKFLSEALLSIKKQTYEKFVCIVSDDCSPEDIKKVFDDVVGSDSRFTYRKNDTNMGSKSLVSHWNLLVDICETDYLIMASDDDIYKSTFLEELNQLTLKYPEANLLRARVELVNESGNLLLKDAIYPEFVNNLQFFRQTFASNSISCEANYCYKSSVLKRKGGFVEFPSAWFTDDATHIMMANNGCINSTSVLFCYRVSTLSISNTWGNAEDARKKVHASLMFLKWINKYVSILDYKEEPWLKEMALRDCYRKIRRNIENNIQNCKFRDFQSLMQQSSAIVGISKITMLTNWLRVQIKK